MAKLRGIHSTWKSKQAMDGAGVKLRRVFGFNEVPKLDPFLLLDAFGSDNPDDYLAGFPWHPHRGIETITYVLEGELEHEDSLGNGGIIRPGEVQWMTAGSGIVHQEMPKRSDGRMAGFQLWSNLPASHKMMIPRYRDIRSGDIPVFETDAGVMIRIVSGEIDGTKGPVEDIVTQPQYYDITMSKATKFQFDFPEEHNVFAYIFSGSASFDDSKDEVIEHTLIHYGHGERIDITTTNRTARFLLVSGKPLNEPIAWRGPIVMNTQEELMTAFREYHEGTFLKHK